MLSLMPLRTLLIVTLLCFVSSGAVSQSLRVTVAPVDTLLFPLSEVAIATIDDFDIDEHGSAIVLDYTSRSLFLYDETSQKVTMLDPEPCTPGFSFTPLTFAANDEYILLNNDGPWGYLFKRDGTCVSGMDEMYTPLRLPVLGADNLAWGMRRTGESEATLYAVDIQGKELESIQLPNGDFPRADHRIRGGGLELLDSGAIVFAPSVSPIMYILDESRALKILDLKGDIERLRLPERDMPAGRAGPDMMKAGGEIVTRRSMNQGVYALKDDIVLLQYYHAADRTWEWLVVDMLDDDRRVSTMNDFGFFRIIDGFGYRLVVPDRGEDGETPNFYFVRYSISVE